MHGIMTASANNIVGVCYGYHRRSDIRKRGSYANSASTFDHGRLPRLVDHPYRRRGRPCQKELWPDRLDRGCGNRSTRGARSGVRHSGEPMTFNKIPANAAVFIDANIFIYHFTPEPVLGPECQLLMERISKYQDFVASTSTHVLSEVSHQLMVLE